jgi:hypothetical protein
MSRSTCLRTQDQSSSVSTISNSQHASHAGAPRILSDDGNTQNEQQSPRPDALTVLRSFLSPHNMHSPTPQTHTANTLKSLYTTVKARSQLAQLGPERIGTLISLLGTLSLPQPRRPCVFANSFASHMEGQHQRNHWVFILMVFRDKRKLDNRLSHSDRYWAMCAELSFVHESSEGDGQNGKRLTRGLVYFSDQKSCSFIS